MLCLVVLYIIKAYICIHVYKITLQSYEKTNFY